MEDNTVYRAVMNHEEQAPIWPAKRPESSGLDVAGKTGREDECLA